jgi:primosomal protein N' (replication factor Y)
MSGETVGSRVAVALPVPLYGLFDYAVPDGSPVPEPGCRVQVPFRRQSLIGVVVGPGSADAPVSVRALERVIDATPLLETQTLRLLVWAAHYYHHPLGEVVATALPTLLRQGRSLDLFTCCWRLKAPEVPLDSLKKAPRLREAYQVLQLHDQRGAPEHILLLMGIQRRQLQQLAERGLAESFERPHEIAHSEVKLAQLPLIPNAEQQVAIEAIQSAQGFAGFLLDGLTGSGKTEVYLQAMQPVLEAGQQVLVLVPEIGLTPQTIGRFRARFHGPVVALHSGMTDVQRLQAWQSACLGEARIVIGTRSAIFVPLPRLGLVVVDEEHDLSFKQQDGFRYHARDLALRRAQQVGCPVVLGSATPSLESLHLAQQGRLTRLQLTERAGHAQPPRMQLIDLRGKKRDQGLSPELIQAMHHTLQAGDQVLVFLNRRGYAPVLLCSACGWQADCPHCDAHLTVHQQPAAHLHCHHCTYQSRFPAACPSCNSVNLLPTGVGTARLEEALRGHFADTELIRVDRDTTSRVGTWEKVYERAHREGPAILLGTQMLAKGHHFPHVTLVAILDADSGFLSADFRAPERTAQLILQVAGRAGRAHKPGRVLIQTWQPDNPLLHTLIEHGYHRFALNTLADRRKALLPPYRHAALLRAESPSHEQTQQFLRGAQARLLDQPGSKYLECWGPVPAPMERRAGVHRGHLLILAQERRVLHPLLADWWLALVQGPERRGLRVSLDIDPLELS